MYRSLSTSLRRFRTNFSPLLSDLPPFPTHVYPHRKLLLVPPGNVLYYRDLKQSHAVVRATTKT